MRAKRPVANRGDGIAVDEVSGVVLRSGVSGRTRLGWCKTRLVVTLVLPMVRGVVSDVPTFRIKGDCLDSLMANGPSPAAETFAPRTHGRSVEGVSVMFVTGLDSC